MYTREELSQHSYFQSALEGRRISDLLDPLTGIVSRAYIKGFVQHLIKEGVPFTFGMIDLDNFKFINDTYGHTMGDRVLSAVAEDLRALLFGCGVVGRFGGDELLFINLRDRSYEEKKRFCQQMYDEHAVFRKSVKYGDDDPFITGTTGLATFPDDAADYDGLFSLIDKTLYRGKVKGRNCYIIYVEEKHRDIEIKKLKRNGLYMVFRIMATQFDSSPSARGKLQAIYQGLRSDLRITNLYYITAEGDLKNVEDDRTLGHAADVSRLVTDEMFTTNSIEEIEEVAPQFYGLLRRLEIETLLVTRIGLGPMTFGWLMCAEPHNLRIWQEDEFAVMFSLSRMMAGFIRGAGTSL